jgi:uncharacterized membrane protein
MLLPVGLIPKTDGVVPVVGVVPVDGVVPVVGVVLGVVVVGVVLGVVVVEFVVLVLHKLVEQQNQHVSYAQIH